MERKVYVSARNRVIEEYVETAAKLLSPPVQVTADLGQSQCAVVELGNGDEMGSYKGPVLLLYTDKNRLRGLPPNVNAVQYVPGGTTLSCLKDFLSRAVVGDTP